MKIISVSVSSFGKLKNLNLRFYDGINVFQNVNGFGKTTLAAFIRAMLYGLNYSYTKRKNERVNDVTRYAPWDGGRFGGSMLVEHNGDTFRIERFFGATAKSETLTVYNERTGVSVDMGTSPGEFFLGLTVESYDRSAYLPQEAVELAPNENLDARLAKLVQNGAEDYDKIQAKLLAYCRERKAGRGNGGSIDVLTGTIEALRRQLYDAEQADCRQAEVAARKRKLADELATLQQQKRNNEKGLDGLKQQRARMQPNEMQIQQKERFDEACKTLNSYPKDFAADCARAEELAEMLEQAEKPRPGRLRYVLLAIAVLLCLVGAGVMLASTYGGIALLVAGLCIGVAAFCVRSQRYALSDTDNERRKEFFAIAAKYLFCDGKDVPTIRKQLREKYKPYENELNIYNVVGRMLAEAGFGGDTSQIDGQITLLQAAQDKLDGQISALLTEKGRLEAEKNPTYSKAAIEEQILAAERRLQTERENLVVAETVSRLLDQAKGNLSGSYLPKLRDRTAELLQAVTHGDFQVAIDGNFAVQLRQNGQTKSLAAFSRGIREITVLCFRLALSELLFDGQIPFLLVDDAFVNFDEENFLRATELLKQLSHSTQIVYFTCHKRLGRLAATAQ